MKTKDLLVPLGIGAAVGALFLLSGSGSSKQPVVYDEVIPDETTPPPATVDPNKVVAKGSKGLEVQQLQKLMSITADGIFGSQTEARLLKLKGVKKVSINQYKKLPTLNQNILPVGTKIMANISFSTPTNLYTAIVKADGTFESDYTVDETVNYGELVGTIKGVSGKGTWYLILREGFMFDKMYFVRATEVKKI